MYKFTKMVGVAALALGLALSVGVANAATQAELEAKIKSLESTLNTLKTDLQQVQVKQAAPAEEVKLPGWVERMKFSGDLRLRWETTRFDDLNKKSKNGNDRLRTRLRFGVESQIHEDVEVGLRMATGSDTDGTSTNVTNGNYFGEISSWGIDRAYVKYTPSFVPQKAIDLSVGKVKNPFLTTKVVWDEDVVPEGAFLKATLFKECKIQPWVLGSVMTVYQPGEADDNIYAYAGQIGLNANFDAFEAEAGISYTDWQDLGTPGYLPTNVHGNPRWVDAAGNTRLSQFKVWDFVAKASYKFSEKGAVDAWANYVNNTDAEGPNSSADTAWGAGIGVKYAQFGADFWYKDVEGNATPGFISDSDSGYVNEKTWALGVSYQAWKYGLFKVTYFDGENIDDKMQGATNDFQTLFIEAIFKF